MEASGTITLIVLTFRLCQVWGNGIRFKHELRRCHAPSKYCSRFRYYIYIWYSKHRNNINTSIDILFYTNNIIIEINILFYNRSERLKNWLRAQWIKVRKNNCNCCKFEHKGKEWICKFISIMYVKYRRWKFCRLDKRNVV